MRATAVETLCVMRIENVDLVTMIGIENTQAFLISPAHGAIRIDLALEYLEDKGRGRHRSLNLARMKKRIACMKEPFVFASHGDAAMARRMTGKRDHQNIRLGVREGTHALKPEPVFAAIAAIFPIGTMSPMLIDIARTPGRHRAGDCGLVFTNVHMHARLGKIG